MKKAVIDLVRKCDTCQRCKDENVASLGLLQPLAIPNEGWKGISMDFIEGLPKSYSKEVILVVVDRLTKYGHFIALSHPYIVEAVVEVFMEHVYKLHGLPNDIVSYRDNVFISKFWQAVFKQMQVHLSLFIAYHLQSNGHAERVNRCLERYWRCMVSQKPKS